METKYKELELILTFLGITFIDYKGHRTSNGFQPSKNLEEFKKCFGENIMTSGQFIEDIRNFDFKDNWNHLMFLVEAIEKTHGVNNAVVLIAKSVAREHYCNIDCKTHNRGKTFFETNISKKIATYDACIKFINWYNLTK